MKKIIIRIGTLVSIVAMILIGFTGIATAIVEWDCPSNTDRPTTGLAYAHSSSNGNTITYEVDVVNKPGSEIIEYCVYPTPGFTGLDSDLTSLYPGWNIDRPGSKAYFGFDSRSAPNMPLNGATNIPVGEAIYTSGLPSSEILLLHIIDSVECSPEGDTSCWRKATTPLSTPIPPIADPNGPYTGIEGTVINFDGSGSSDPDGSITSYVWNFGDSITGTGVNPTHVYTQNGVYTVTLTVTDNSGATNSSTTTATITDADPVSIFSGTPLSGQEPLTVTFTDSSTSYDGIILWRWDFENDGIIDSTEQNPVHQYTLAGTYTVGLTVCETDGDCASSTNTVTVTSVPTPTPTTPTPTPTGTVTPTPTTPTPTPTPPPGDTIRPSQPLCPVAIAINPTTISVSWQASVDNVGVVGYKVYRSIDGENYYYLTTTTNLYYIDPGRTTGTTYYYVIIAIDAAGNPSLPSDETYATPRDVNSPVVTVPSSITAEATSPSGASVTFSASATDDIDGSIIPICNPTSGSTFHLGITTVTCTATDNAGNIGSAIFSITVQDTTPPTTPSGLSATAISTSRIDLSWTASYDAVGVIQYIIYRSLDGVNFASIGTSTTTTFQNVGLMANTTYYYRIGARDAANNPSTNSGIASAKTFAPPPPTPTPTPTPTGTPGTPGPTPTPTPTPIPDYPPILTLPSNMILEATSPSGAVATFSGSAYDNEDGESKIVTCDPPSGSTFPLGTTYITCTATDSVGNIGSGIFSVTVQDTTPPTAPSLIATAKSTSRIDLSWTASTDIVSVRDYYIYRSLNNIDWSGIGTTAGTSFINMGLNQNTTYYYYVVAYDTTGNPSVPSNVANAKTFILPPSPPPTPTPTATVTATATATPSPSPTVNPCAPPELGNTPQGQDVEVPVASTIGVTFDTVLECGDTTAVAYYDNEWTSLPSGYEQVLFYDIDTSATYEDIITVKVAYSNSDIPTGVSEQTLRMFHHDNGNWIDVTTALDTTQNIITGRVSSLSPFGIGGVTGSGSGGGGGGSGTGMRGSGLDSIGIIMLGICLVSIGMLNIKRKI